MSGVAMFFIMVIVLAGFALIAYLGRPPAPDYFERALDVDRDEADDEALWYPHRAQRMRRHGRAWRRVVSR